MNEIALRVDFLGCSEVTTTPLTTQTFMTTTTIATTTTTTTTVPPSITTLVSIETPNCWTEWVNIDSPNSGPGDFEDIASIRRKYEFCGEPVKIECRAIKDRKQALLTGQILECNLESGLVCWNSNNGADGCDDYELRFYCPCEGTTVESTMPPTTLSTMAPAPCVDGWTEWFNSHSPDGTREYETVQGVRRYGGYFCANDQITALECRQKNAESAHSLQRGVICDLRVGLYCDNTVRNDTDICHDYEVRFYCDCPISTVTSPPPTRTIATAKVLMTTTLKPCSYWSEWINDNHPSVHSQSTKGVKGARKVTGDVERKILWRFQQEFGFCLEGTLSNIECRDAITNVDYTKTGDMELRCNVQTGFRCKGSDQPDGFCRDYKIRYFCECEQKSTTVTLRPTTPTPLVPPCTSFYQMVDGPSPLPNSNLRASTSLTPSSGPQSARLSSTLGPHSDGAWVASSLNEDQYLEVNLGHIRPVYGVITKGRDEGNEWVMSYHILYSRDGYSFSYVKNELHQHKLFSGNYDSDSPVEHIFVNPFEAKYIRVQPVAYMNEIALRVDFLGCSEGTTTPVTTQAPPVCVDEMGMQNGNISDDQIKFSTVYGPIAQPSSVRLYAQQVWEQPGAWVAGSLDQEQYIQIDLLEPRTVTGVITQGRDLVDHWVSAFTIAYSNSDHEGSVWSYIHNKDGQVKVFPGNFDSDTPVKTFFQPPLRARFVRVNPQKWHNWISMRLEILGCFEPYGTTTSTEMTSTEVVLNTERTTVRPPHLGDCNEPMGFENHQLPDLSIYVSSSAFVWSGASRIRLNQHADGQGTGGWVAASYDSMLYVMIDFLDERNITGIVTQGRDNSNMWVESYTVEYSLDNVTWNQCRDASTKKYIFSGNVDNDSKSTRVFDQSIVARFLKINIKSYHNKPALRLEILGCFEPYVSTTTATTTTTSTPEITTEECLLYGPWLSLSDSIENGDEERMDELISYSGVCSSPISIQCREIITRQDYTKTGQNVMCDLVNGLVCRNSEQPNGRCFNYEVRIGCWYCSTTSVRTTPLPLALCPETPDVLTQNCPLSCPLNHSCDGRSCAPDVDCPCYKEGKRFKAGDIHITSSCDKCDCILGGYSRCQPIKCPPCAEGEISEIKGCQCECKPCEVGTILCPTSRQCINETLWCDGIVDCPDDEIICSTTLPSTTTTLMPTTTRGPPICTLIVTSETSTCEMHINRFSTFDGLYYQYDICDHILMKEIANRFSVTVHKRCSETYFNQCHRYVVIYMDEIEIQLGPGSDDVKFNGREVPTSHLWLIGKRFKNFGVKKRGNHLVFRSYKYNFEVSWDPSQHAKIKVSKCMLHNLIGMCGLYNAIPEDDYTKPDNSLATSSVDFGNSWSMSGLTTCYTPLCLPDVLTIAAQLCANLYKEPFANCSAYFDMNTQVDICMEFMCECLKSTDDESLQEKCRCEAYESFVEDCEEEKEESLGEWRITYNCAPTCPPGLEWQECGPGCDLTCESYHDRESICEDRCVPGCYCPPGLIHHNNHCVKQEICQDCICRGHGDPNYITFDNQYYAFQGNCTYILAQHLTTKHLFQFQVLGINDECPEEPHTSCTAGVKVLWNGHTIEKYQYKPVSFDGTSLGTNQLKIEKDGVSVTYIPGKSTIIHIKAISLVVRYFDRMFAFNIELPAYFYINKTEGLCGICNFDKSDDLYHRDGYVTDNVEDFAYSWLVDNTRDECIIPPVIPPTPPPNICNFTLNPCDVFIDPSLYSKSCQNDISYSHNPNESMCRTKFQYAQQCCEKGIFLEQWLLDSGCVNTCPGNMVFKCTSACQKTCDDFESPEICDLMPLYTCTCPDGHVLKDGLCVHPDSCVEEKSCVYQHKFEIKNDLQEPLLEENYYNMTYMPGSYWLDGLCQNCSCIEMDDQVVSQCYIERCLDSSEFPDADSYLYQQEMVPNKCCPKYKRIKCMSNGMLYSVGGEWPSPDGDKCKTLRCVPHMTYSDSTEVLIHEKNIVCDKTCPAYAEYVEPPPESPDCCGHCKPVACEENGTIYPVGTQWQSSTNPCLFGACHVTDNMATTIYTATMCAAVEPNCPKEYIVKAENGCCDICNFTIVETCKPIEVMPAQTVGYFTLLDKQHGTCSNSQPLMNMTKCSGQCESRFSYSSSFDSFESTCKCCLAREFEERLVSLECPDGHTLVKIYQDPLSCHCSSCRDGRFGPIELPTPY